MENKTYNNLKKNTLLIAISNIGSKAISFILAPLYSFFLTTSEYGQMDIIVTTVSLLLPFVCFDIFEASFRYSSETSYSKKTVLSTTFMVCILESIVICIACAIIALFIHIPEIIVICIISAILDAIYQVLIQFVRGSGRVLDFAIAGGISSVSLLLLNICFMVILSMGFKGWLISFIGAKIIVIVFSAYKAKVFQCLRIRYINISFLKEAIRFCVPLIPSASMWWIMNASDRYVIALYCGISATGIYAVANKLPSILSILENVFYQAWQSTALETFNDNKRDSIYSEVFFKYFKFLTIGVLAILVILKPMILGLFSKEYNAAWICAPILVIGVMIHALAGNLGTLYTVFKNTTGALKTTIIGALTNIILNLIFVYKYGYNAAAFTTVIGYILVLYIRWKDISKFVKLKINKCDFVLSFFVLLIQLLLYYVDSNIALGLRFIIFVIYVIYNRDIVIGLFYKK